MKQSFLLFSTLVLGVVALLLSAYCMLGVLQASLLFSGERAVRNWQIWGASAALFLALAIALFWGALAMVRRHRAAAGAAPRLLRGGPSQPD